MTDLHAETQAVVDELDPDGGGFSSKEATNLLHHRIESAGITEPDGKPKKHISMMLRSACAAMISNYKPERAARLSAGSGQGDFQQISSQFDHWVYDFAALGETSDAVRKQLVKMNLAEVRMVIALKRKKSSETLEEARRLQTVIDHNPSWRDQPNMTLGDMLSRSARTSPRISRHQQDQPGAPA